MPIEIASIITAPSRLLESGKERYACRRLGAGSGPHLLCLQHFMRTMDNGDTDTDPLSQAWVDLVARCRRLRHSGAAVAFWMGWVRRFCDVLGLPRGGIVAQQEADFPKPCGDRSEPRVSVLQTTRG